MVTKPSLDVSHTLEEIVTELADKIKESANVKVKKKEYFKSTEYRTTARKSCINQQYA